MHSDLNASKCYPRSMNEEKSEIMDTEDAKDTDNTSEKTGTYESFLKSFSGIQKDLEDTEMNVTDSGDKECSDAYKLYKEQLESAMSRMGLTMDDYLNARSMWSENTMDEKSDHNEELTSDQELAQLGLDEDDIREVNEMASCKIEKEHMTNNMNSSAQDPMVQILSPNIHFAATEKNNKFKDLIEEIRKDSEYIREIPKWQAEMQKRLDTIKQMRLDMEAESLRRKQEYENSHFDLKAEIQRRIAELNDSIDTKLGNLDISLNSGASSTFGFNDTTDGANS